MAAIDVGAHSARMLVAEVYNDSSYTVLEELEQPVPLGANVFQTGKIGNSSIRLLCEIFQNFKQKLDEYQIKLYRGIATSAVREASNSEIFLERIKHCSGIEVNVFQGINEARLDYLTIMKDIPSTVELKRKTVMVADIGTGACQMSMYEKGNMCFTETIRTGTLRILEEMPSTVSNTGMAQQLISPFISKTFSQLEHISYNLKADTLVAMGATVRALAGIIRKPVPGQSYITAKKDKFRKAFDTAAGRSPTELVREYKISHEMAEAIIPCCLITDHLFKISEAKELVIPMTSTKDALLMDFINETMKVEDPFQGQILSVVKRLTQKYKCDDKYTADTVAFSEILFEKLRPLIGLSSRELLLLKLAAYLHKSGLFISNRAHHKHSFYIISSTEIPGLTDEQKQIVALTARYHRKAFPKAAHLEYNILGTEAKTTVNKLSALLRLACGLAESCNPDKKIKIKIREDSVLIHPEEGTSLLMENKFIERDASFFYYIFSRKIELD